MTDDKWRMPRGHCEALFAEAISNERIGDCFGQTARNDVEPIFLKE